MNHLLKTALTQRGEELSEAEMELINRQTLRRLEAGEVFAFRLAACDDQVDRDYERFSLSALNQMADLFVGQPVLMDHRWSAGSQTARVYAGSVEQTDGKNRLILRCYMPRTEKTAETIQAIECGILRECSVGVAVSRAVCSVCGADNCKTLCSHCRGQEYDGKTCHFILDEVVDAYEVSMVAVPAQPEAGVIKSKRYGGSEPTTPGKAEPTEEALLLAQARMELEEKRYGGNGV